MERRSWPWKKKSDKGEKAAAAAESGGATLVSGGTHGDKDNYKKPNYVQISVESYTHLTGLEEQVKTYEEQVQALEDQIKDFDEKLSAAHLEMTNKESLVKQHAKVAEEAVSGWEKAEAEALALKNHMESVTLSKLTAEDRAAHLDGALKECMQQIRNLKEEHERKLQEVVLSKTKQWEKIKLELEAKIANLDHELLRSAAENAALTRSLQERSNMVVKITEEKSQAEAEIELLKSNIESCEREINSLKYELHIISKELEIRNEEKNMSMRSAEVANKQHMEGVKKIAKLEAECQRLRGLVRKKLPGPAALAQMKLEVESLGRDYGDSRLRRSPVKPASPHSSSASEFSLDTTQKFHKENEFLTERLLAMEEETKMLKEALAKRNSELQASRNICAKTSSRLQSLEAKLQIANQAGNPPSLTSLSEDGNDDDQSCADSWATALISELSQFKKEKNNEKSTKAENAKHMELMDDFLEMEKLACLNENAAMTISDSPKNKTSEIVQDDVSGEFSTGKDTLPQHSLTNIPNEVNCPDAICSRPICPGDAGLTGEGELALSQDNKGATETVHTVSQELVTAISQIHDFVLFLRKEAIAVHDTSADGDGLSQNIEEFSATFNKGFFCSKNLADFICDLSLILAKASELRFNFLGYKATEAEINSADCIDKVALPENKVVQKDSSGEAYQNGCALISSPTSNPEVPDDGNLVAAYGSNMTSCKVSLEEFEDLKSEKDNIAIDLCRRTEDLEMTKSQLQETEQLLVEAKSQLASVQKSNSLAETQLKCMAESYRSLETRAQELETEVNLLRAKTETLENELQVEKRSHQDALTRCKELQEQLQVNETCSVCSAIEVDPKAKQEKELAAAAEKLAECQETIFLLGKQLKSLRPQAEDMGSPYSERSQRGEGIAEDEPTISGMNLQDIDQVDLDSDASPKMHRTGAESPMDLYKHQGSPSDSEVNILRSPVASKNRKHRATKSISSSSSSAPTPEKQSRGFSRFFSSKGKNNDY